MNTAFRCSWHCKLSAIYYLLATCRQSVAVSPVVPAWVAQLDGPSDWRPRSHGFNPRRSRQHSFVEIDHEIFSTVILSLPLIQEGQLSVSGERMCTILVNRLEYKACPVNVWLGKLTALDMTPLGWLGRKTSTQTKFTSDQSPIDRQTVADWAPIDRSKVARFQSQRVGKIDRRPISDWWATDGDFQKTIATSLRPEVVVASLCACSKAWLRLILFVTPIIATSAIFLRLSIFSRGAGLYKTVLFYSDHQRGHCWRD